MFILSAVVVLVQGVSVFAQNAFVYTATYQGEMAYMNGGIINYCFCNSTACSMRNVEAIDASSFESNFSVWSDTSCTGTPVEVLSEIIPLAMDTTFDCQDGSELPITVTAAIVPADYYSSTSLASFVFFKYANPDDCSLNNYFSFDLSLMYTCGGTTFGDICESDGKTTTTSNSANSATTIVYTDSSCKVVEAESTVTIEQCSGSANDDEYPVDDEYYIVKESFSAYDSLLVQGIDTGSSSSNDDGTLIGVICGVFGAFILGVAGTWFYFTKCRKGSGDMKETLVTSQV